MAQVLADCRQRGQRVLVRVGRGRRAVSRARGGQVELTQGENQEAVGTGRVWTQAGRASGLQWLREDGLTELGLNRQRNKRPSEGGCQESAHSREAGPEG